MKTVELYAIGLLLVGGALIGMMWWRWQPIGRWRMALIAVCLVALVLVRWTIVFIDPREVGVVTSLVSPGGIRAEPLHAGLHVVVPILERVHRYPIAVQNYTMSMHAFEGARSGNDAIEARTADGQVVRLDLTLLFRIDPNQVVALHVLWQERYGDELVRPALRALVRGEAARYDVHQINSSRRLDFEQGLRTRTQALIESHGLIVEQMLLRNIDFSPEYARTIEQKMMARQDVQRSRFQAERMANLAEGERQRLEITARGEANARRIRARAEAEARVLEAGGEAEALHLIGAALQQRVDLLLYRYIERLSPALQAMLLPAKTPLMLPLPDLEQEHISQ